MTVEFQRKKLIEVCKLINGRAYSKPELLAEGKYPVLRVGNFFTNDHWYYSDLELDEDKYCDKGDLLYAWSASFGPRIWHADKVIYHYHIWKVVPDLTLIDKKFLFYFFEWDADQIKKDQGAGTTMVHVSKGSMENREINLPQLNDQARIVTLLDEAFADIASAKANAEKNLQNARDFFAGQLQAVFDSGIDNWNSSTLGQVYDVRDGTHDSPKYHDEGFPLITSKNLKNEGLTFDDVKLISLEDYNKINERSAVHQGDILLAMIGTIGNPTVVETIPNFAIKNVALLKVPENQNNYFLRYYLSSPSVIAKMQAEAKGTTQKFVGLGYLRAFPISVPELSEQEQIVRKLDELRTETNRLEAIYRQKITALDDLKKSLLYQAFSGQL